MRKLKSYHILIIGAIVFAVAYLISCGTKDPVSPEVQIPAGTIVYVKHSTTNGYGIYSMDAGGGNRTKLIDDAFDEMIPDCSCDGDDIVYIIDVAGIFQICTMNMNQPGYYRQLTYDSFSKFCPRWSPGDSMIAFHSSMDIENTDIWVLVLDRDTLIQITNDPNMDVSPSWSPDGKSIIFASNRDGDYDIYKVAIGTGADPVKLTNDTVGNDSPQYSHDGEWIAFISPDESIVESDPEVFIMRADGSEATQLTHNTYDDFTPCWSPDDTWIAFRSRLSGPARYDICRIRADGSGYTNITNNEDNDAWPDWTE